jgi:predicted ATPase with chaperone activity
MDKQQTAVEWLVEQLQKTRDWQRVINEANESSSSVRDVIAEAREMQKEQMIEFAWHYSNERLSIGDLIDGFYQTYGGNK